MGVYRHVLNRPYRDDFKWLLRSLPNTAIFEYSSIFCKPNSPLAYEEKQMSHETILIVTTTFILPTIKFPQGLLKDHS